MVMLGTKPPVSKIKERPAPPTALKAKPTTKDKIAAVNAKLAEDEDEPFDITTPPEGLKLPKTLGATADLLLEIKNKRLAADKAAKVLKKQETWLGNFFIDRLPKDDARGSAGKLARVTLFPKVKPTVEDWDKFYAYIAKTKSWELLQRRVGEKAIQERWDAKKEVPGIGRYDFIAVSVTKL